MAGDIRIVSASTVGGKLLPRRATDVPGIAGGTCSNLRIGGDTRPRAASALAANESERWLDR
jgi:hypothetical protein